MNLLFFIGLKSKTIAVKLPHITDIISEIIKVETIIPPAEIGFNRGNAKNPIPCSMPKIIPINAPYINPFKTFLPSILNKKHFHIFLLYNYL